MELYKEKECELRNVIDSTLALNWTFENYVNETNTFINRLLEETKDYNVLKQENRKLKAKAMSGLTEKETLYLEEILNEGIKDYLDSGYYLDDDYVVTLRGMLAKFNLKESHPYDIWYKRYDKDENNNNV